jgi:Tfp pilus assembly protein PilF
MNKQLQLCLQGTGIVLLVIIAFFPALSGGFIWDDDAYVTGNALLTAPDGLKRIWFSLDSPSQYFPLTYTTFFIERGLWGLNPAGYHWVNLLLHAANALLVWQLLKRLSVPGSWLAAAIFALHPVQVESVAWIAERKNVLSLFFYLLALMSWIEFIEERPRPLWRFYLLSLVYSALALLSKTTACTIPIALVLVLWLKEKPINRFRLMQIIPFIGLGVGMGFLTMWWERYHQGTQGELFGLGLPERILVASHAIWFYAGKLVWPVDLTFSYPHWTINSSDPLAYGWLCLGMICAAAIFLIRRFVGRSVEVAMLFYVASLCPVLGFIMLYTFRYTFVADHYQYVASIGPIALAAAGITMAFKSRHILMKSAFCGALLLTLGMLTWRQCGVYHDLETLWRDTLAKNPDSGMAHSNLGALLLYKKENIGEAVEHFRRAVQINPDLAGTYFHLGVALINQGQYDEALENFQKSIQIDPDSADAYFYSGVALGQLGRTKKAIIQYRYSLQLNPEKDDALNNLTWILATSSNDELRDGAEAVQLGEQACALTHYSKPLYIGTLAAAYAECGRFSDAVTTAEKAEKLAAAAGLKDLAEKNRKLLELYQAAKPYHETQPSKH